MTTILAVMSVSLPPELESLVAKKVADGTYSSEVDVLRAALQLLSAHDDAEAQCSAQLRAAAEVGHADLRAGRKSLLSAADIKRMARERQRA